MKHLDRFLLRLDDVSKCGSGWKARCPCARHGKHGNGDTNPSLSISIGEGNKILIYCFGGCKHYDILEEIGLENQDLWPKDGDVAEQEELDSTRAVLSYTPPPAAAAANARDQSLTNKVYSALKAKLSLSDDHHQNLRDRGLTDEQINRNGYRSLKFFEFRQKVAAALREEFGDELLKVPGFRTKKSTITVVEMPNGMLIPIRDVGEGIIAFQLRSDKDKGDGAKYRWFSGGETSSGSPAHVPLGVKAADLIRITEGPLKADIAWALDGIPTIAVAGVSAWSSVLPVLEELQPKTVHLAFDSDAQDNNGVATALADCYAALKDRYDVQIAVWPKDKGKGLDDLLCGGGKPEVLASADAAKYINTLLSEEASEEIPSIAVTTDTVEVIQNQAPLPDAAPSSRSLKGPDKFPYGLGDPAPFPLESFPPPLQEVANQISKAVNCPIDFTGCLMIVTSATAIGRSRQIEPLEDWKISPRLYIGLVGDPGSGKTPALSKIMEPLWRKNSEWADEYAQEKEGYDTQKLTYDVQNKEFIKHAAENIKRVKSRQHKKTEKDRTFDDTDAFDAGN